MDDRTDSDVAEDEKEEEDKSLDLFDRYVRGFFAGPWRAAAADMCVQVHAMSLEWCGAPPGERVVLWLVLWAKMRLV
jgi:hypothetical protein